MKKLICLLLVFGMLFPYYVYAEEQQQEQVQQQEQSENQKQEQNQTTEGTDNTKSMEELIANAKATSRSFYDENGSSNHYFRTYRKWQNQVGRCCYS